MQLLRSRGTRIAGLLTAVAMLAGALVVGAGSAAADTLSFSLLPAPGANSFGSGVVSLTPVVGATQVQIDLAGARIGNTYNLSVCTNTGVGFSCTFGGSVTTDVTGSFHGAVFAAPFTQIDLVTLVNSVDQTDAYQAVTGTTPVTTTPIRGVAPALPDPNGTGGGFPTGNPVVIGGSGFAPAGAQVAADGTIMLPMGTTTAFSSVCPPGFSGPLLVASPFSATGTMLIFC